jgi:hypothetical protein
VWYLIRGGIPLRARVRVRVKARARARVRVRDLFFYP